MTHQVLCALRSETSTGMLYCRLLPRPLRIRGSGARPLNRSLARGSKWSVRRPLTAFYYVQRTVCPLKKSLKEPFWEKWAPLRGAPILFVIINWATRHSVSVLPASTNAQRQKDNLNSFGFQFSDEEMLAIDDLDGKVPKPAEKNPNEVSVVFANHGDGPINSFWVSDSNEDIHVGSINAGGGELLLTSFHGHRHLDGAGGKDIDATSP